MKRDLVCPLCKKNGFASDAIWKESEKLKCFHCGEWSTVTEWQIRLPKGIGRKKE